MYMKGNFCFYVVAAVFMSVVFHCSCSRLGEAGLEGNGRIIVSFVRGGELFTKAYLNLPDTSDFLLRITSASGDVIFNGKYGDCPEILDVGPGSYVVSALSSEFSKPAFDAPQFGDEQCVVVNNGSVVNVRLLCRQRNVGIRLDISSDFLTACPGASLFLKSDAGKLMYSYSEKRTAYFSPGPVSLMMSSGSSDQVLMTRDMKASEMLSLDVAVSDLLGGKEGGLSMVIDTSRIWVSDECMIGAGNSGYVSEDALSVAEARESAGLEDVWVCGYVVGGDLTSASASFAPPFESRTNLLLGSRSSSKDRKSCLSVQLPDGELREKLNLVDNPGLLGRRIAVKGDLVSAYYGIPGVKNTIEYQIL